MARIREEEYTDGPGGLSGNDDSGQMSAWYVFAALGFYPVDPVSGDYQLGSPLFKKTVISLDSGKKFTINVFKNSDKAIYIRSVNLNGAPYKLNTIAYQAIAKGGVMNIYLSENHK